MLLTLLFFLFAFYFLGKKTDGLQGYSYFYGWLIKLGFAGLYLWIYTSYYGDGALTADTQQFMVESKMLCDISTHSWKDYFTFLFGFESTPQVLHYLSETDHWSAGDLTLLNDSKNVIRFNSVLYFFTNGNVLVHVLIIVSLTTICLREFFVVFKKRIWLNPLWFWVLLVGFPSVAFWTGSVLKEPFMLMGLCLFLAGLFDQNQLKWRWMKLILGILIMLMIKPYVFFFSLIAIIIFFVSKNILKKPISLAFLGFLLVTILAGFAFKSQSDKVLHYLTRKQFDFVNLGIGGRHVYADTCFFYFEPDQYDCLRFVGEDSVTVIKEVDAKKVTFGHALPFEDVHLVPDGTVWLDYFHTDPSGSYIKVELLNNSYLQLLKNTPTGLFNATFRPTPFDSGGIFKYLSFLETLGLLAFFGFAMFSKRISRTLEEKRLLGLFVIIAFFILLLIGYTTPVLGAIVRYRMPAYLLLFIAACIGTKKRKNG